MNTVSSISHLPYMPLDPSWIEQSQAFFHADARLARAYVRLLIAAWRGVPAGSIPSSQAYLAAATSLPEDFVSEHYVTLTDGFELHDDGRLYHGGIAKACARLTDNFSKEIEGYALAAAMAVQDPEQFVLGAVETRTKKPRGKTLLPKDFGFDKHPDLRGWCAENDYPHPEQQDWVMNKFCDWAWGKGEMYKEWDAVFRNFARNQIGYGRAGMPMPRSVARNHGPSPFSGLSRSALTRGDAAAMRNLEALERADSSLQSGVRA